MNKPNLTAVWQGTSTVKGEAKLYTDRVALVQTGAALTGDMSYRKILPPGRANVRHIVSGVVGSDVVITAFCSSNRMVQHIGTLSDGGRRLSGIWFQIRMRNNCGTFDWVRDNTTEQKNKAQENMGIKEPAHI